MRIRIRDVMTSPAAERLGDVADRVVMHRLAEASVEAFMDRVAASMTRGALSRAMGGNGGAGA